MKTQTLEYNKETGQITLNEYDEGDEVVITKKKSLEKVTKFQVKK